MAQKFDFVKLMEQAKTIDKTIESISKKIINCDIGDGDATDALSTLDNDLSEIEGKLDFLCVDMMEEIEEINERNSEMKKFFEDIDSKLERLEYLAKEFKSPAQTYLDTPVSGRGYRPRYLK